MRWVRSVAAIAGVLPLALAACGPGDDVRTETEGAAPSRDNVLFRYSREFIFVASRGGDPLVVPIVFQASDAGTQFERVVRGWLARGATWDRFLDETGSTSRAGGVWRVLPLGDLRIIAGGSTEVQSFGFQRGDRRLRLSLEDPLTGWNQGGETRFRLLGGQLAIGPEIIAGRVLESLRVDRTLADGWPPGQDFDALFLTSGDSIQLVLAETLSGGAEGEGFAWIRAGGSDRNWQDGQIRWMELTPYQEARRDVPTRWSFQIPGAGVIGEVEAQGFDVLLGPERGGRRAVEIRYTVSGWAEIQGARRQMEGMIRHTQQ